LCIICNFRGPLSVKVAGVEFFPRFSAVVVIFGLFSALEVSATAQSTASPSSAQQPVHTFHANKRVVLTDVTVTDRHGNPIHGLKASAFQSRE
jgi:hypothetical protein